MIDDSRILRRVAWSDLCPWLLILRSFRIAIQVKMLILASVASLLTTAGWATSHFLFRPVSSTDASPRAGVAELVKSPQWPGSAPLASYRPPGNVSEIVRPAADVPQRVLQKFLGGWKYFIELPPTWSATGFLLFGGLWSLVIWALAGGAILRIAVVHLGRQRHVSLGAACAHALRKLPSYLGAPLLPLSAVAVGIGLLWLLGLVMRSVSGAILGAFLWPLVLAGCVVSIILLLGVVVGWPFMWTALGAEVDADSWDAISRGYAYALQKPQRYVAYALVAIIQGTLGWLLVYHFSELCLAFGRNMILWGAGDAATHLGPELFGGLSAATGVEVPWYGWLIRLGNGAIRALAQAYGYSYFLTSMAAMYLLLRFDINQTEHDEVYLPEDEDGMRLPSLPAAPTS